MAIRQYPSLPILDGAMRAYHLLVGIVVALAAGWLGAQLPDLIEPARSPHHRGFWHSKLVTVALLTGGVLLASGYVLGGTSPKAFILRTALLFLIVGYASHLGVDHFSTRGLPGTY
jgi:membrane-bound metal-dependent hydrolase YbcI (DUF457 family)